MRSAHIGKMICAAVVFAALLGGCGNMTQGKGAATAEVAAFHKQLDAQDFGAIISAADPQLFKVTSQADTQKFLSVVHRDLGNVTASQNTSWNVRTFNADTMVVLQQNTQFQKGSGTETFNFRITAGKAHLISYYIDSPQLTLK